jgi:hypothetical protein
MNLITAIGRLLENQGIIRGDTDLPTTLSDLQHGATIRLARNAIQDELNELISDNLIPYEHAGTGSVVTVAGTRSYALPANFIRMFGNAYLIDSTSNNWIPEYPGGEIGLQSIYNNYKTQQSEPQYWYFDATTTKKIAFWPVPQSAKTYTFDYEMDVSVTAATDTLPFHNESEAQAFCRLAGRRFKFMFENMDVVLLAQDPEHQKGKSTLFNLIKGVNPPARYAPYYR